MIGGKAFIPPQLTQTDPKCISILVEGRWTLRMDPHKKKKKHYLSLHLVKGLSDEPFVHDWDSATWSEKEIIDDFNLRLLLKALPAKRHQGRPKPKPVDESTDGQYSVSHRLVTLARTPGEVAGWRVMVRKESTNDNGKVIYKNFTGIVRPWPEEGGTYCWVVEFDHQALQMRNWTLKSTQKLSTTYRSRYPFTQPFW
ncbi:hypothetical protein PHMEG_00010577 [Phytophthora megakarya]|uniref:Uncharacterized protein n=1 Tax=Phytophthora megakarya TaxID=4795 RepID=A0A225WFU1_9STRA|nr:hypothetical protein PHMEG_00010577 [Phytophthora megakarya]